MLQMVDVTDLKNPQGPREGHVTIDDDQSMNLEQQTINKALQATCKKGEIGGGVRISFSDTQVTKSF